MARGTDLGLSGATTLEEFFTLVISGVKDRLGIFENWTEERDNGIFEDEEESDDEFSFKTPCNEPRERKQKHARATAERVQQRRDDLDEVWQAYVAMARDWRIAHDVDTLTTLWNNFKVASQKITAELEIMSQDDQEAVSWLQSWKNFIPQVDERMEAAKRYLAEVSDEFISPISERKQATEAKDPSKKLKKSFLKAEMHDMDRYYKRRFSTSSPRRSSTPVRSRPHSVKSPPTSAHSRNGSSDKPISSTLPPSELKPQKLPEVANASTIALLSSIASQAGNKPQGPNVSQNSLLLLHEIALNPSFTIHSSPLEQQVRAVVHRAFFDDVAKAFAKGGMDAIQTANGLLDDVRTRLLPLLPANTSPSTLTAIRNGLATPIDDFNTIRLGQNLANVLTTMQSLCAPARDFAIKGLLAQIGSLMSTGGLSPQALAIGYQKVLEMLDLMERDIVQWIIPALRPELKTVAKEMERITYIDPEQEETDKPSYKLPLTRDWILKSRKELGEPQRSTRTEYVHSMAVSVFSSEPVSLAEMQGPNVLPEILSLDAKRLWILQNRLQALIIIAALCTISKSSAPLLAESIQRLWAILSDSDTNIKNLSEEMARLVPAEQRDLVRRMVDRTLRESDPLWKILSERLKATVETLLAVSLEGSSISSVVERPNTAGFEQVADEAGRVITDLCTIGEWTWEVWGDIIQTF